MLKLQKTFFIAIFISLAISSCISRVEKHGYMFDLSDHQLLTEGIFTKNKVLQLMGSPTLISDLDGREVWIYYAEDVRKLLFFKPDIINREIIMLSFNKNETLTKLENYSLENEKNLRFAENYTKVHSNKNGVFKSIFGNVGSVKPQ